MLTRREWLAALASVLGALAARPAFAQDYPARPVRMIVPYAAGGATDSWPASSRRLESELGPAVVVDNRGGGASQVGTQAIASAPPDGYTIGLIDSAFTINPGLFGARLPYDTRERLRAGVADRHRAAGARGASLGAGQHRAGVGRARQSQKPGMTYALPGLGTPVHLAGEQLRQVAGIEIVSVPYRGAGPSIADFIAGQVQMTFATVPRSSSMCAPAAPVRSGWSATARRCCPTSRPWRRPASAASMPR